MEQDYWLHHYADNGVIEEYSDPDFDVAALVRAAAPPDELDDFEEI